MSPNIASEYSIFHCKIKSYHLEVWLESSFIKYCQTDYRTNQGWGLHQLLVSMYCVLNKINQSINQAINQTNLVQFECPSVQDLFTVTTVLLLFFFLQEADIKAQANGNLQFRELPRAASILDQPVISTLYYCCLYHYTLEEVCIRGVNYLGFLIFFFFFFF